MFDGYIVLRHPGGYRAEFHTDGEYTAVSGFYPTRQEAEAEGQRLMLPQSKRRRRQAEEQSAAWNSLAVQQD